MQSLLSPDNHFAIWAILVGTSAFGIYGERKGWFKQVSGAVVTIFFAAILVTINVLPSATNPDLPVAAYGFVFDYIIPISIPLLLFNVNFKKIVKESGRMLLIFLIGALGVVLGAVAAFYLIDVGPETYKLAGVFIGTYTGGSVNFMSVGAALDFLDSPLFSATIVVDNVFTNIFVMFLFFIPLLKFLQKYYPTYEELETEDTSSAEATPGNSENLQLEKMALALTISGITCALGFWLAEMIGLLFNLSIRSQHF